MPYRRSAPGVEPPLWSRAAKKPPASAMRVFMLWGAMGVLLGVAAVSLYRGWVAAGQSGGVGGAGAERATARSDKRIRCRCDGDRIRPRAREEPAMKVAGS